MRFSISVNGQHTFTAGVAEAGFVGGHFNARPGRTEPAAVRGQAHFSPTSEETISFDWPTTNLALGDVVEVRCVSDPPTEPSQTRTSRKSEKIAIRSHDLAVHVNSLINTFCSDLIELMQRVEQEPDDPRRFRFAVGKVMAELLAEIQSPLWAVHPDLQPEGWRSDTDSEPEPE